MEALARMLEVSVEAFDRPSEHDRSIEMLTLWLALPSVAAQDAALACLRALATEAAA